MSFWIKNTNGRQDAILTMALIGFLVVLVKVLLSDVSFVFLEKTIAFGSIDAGVIGAVLTPTLGAYVARRYTDRKFKVKENE